MTIFAQEGPTGALYADAVAAERYAGGLATWEEVEDGAHVALRATAHTWNRAAAATLEFTVEVVGGGAFELWLRADARGADAWAWVDVDGRQGVTGPADLGRLRVGGTGQHWTRGGASTTVTLGAGRHTLRVVSISSALALSRLLLAPSGAAPVSEGEAARGAAALASGPAPVQRTDTYVDWLLDEAREPYRALLVALEYDGGVLTVGSAPYLSDYGQAFDDCLIGEPTIEASAGGRIDLGDVDLVLVEEEERDPARLLWRGYAARLLYGDTAWPLARFATLATPTIEQCRAEGARRYRFNLRGSEARYERRVVEEETTRSETVREALAWVLAQFPGAAALGFLNVHPEQLERAVTYTLAEADTMSAVLDTLARSIGAFRRASPEGGVLICRADTDAPASLTIGAESIVEGTVQAQEPIAATKRVAVVYGADVRVERETGADTGTLDEVSEERTYLAEEADALALLDALAARYANERMRYTLEVRGLADMLQVGDVVSIDDADLTGTGEVVRLRRSALANGSLIEVLI